MPQRRQASLRGPGRPIPEAGLQRGPADAHDREDARDVAQTVFLKVYEHLADYDPSYRFYSWIYRIALNESINTLDRRRPAVGARPRNGRQRAGSRRHGRAAPAQRRDVGGDHEPQRDEYRAVIVLRHFLDCSYEDMATILEVPEKTVKSRLFSARQLLKTAMASKGWAPS